MEQKLQLRAKGLYTHPNDLSEIPEGALSVADNVVIDREGVVESRRGFKAYSSAFSAKINQILEFSNKLIVHYNSKLAFDTDDNGTFQDYTGAYAIPDTGFRIRGVESNNNIYFNTSTGIKKLADVTATTSIVDAGAYKGLDGVATTTGVTGHFATDSQIAYRIVWGYEDTNNNLVLGSPSQRIIATNDSTTSVNSIITFTIPDGVTTNWFYQIYRSQCSANATTEPNDELQLVYEDNPTAAEIVAKSITATDITPTTLMGAYLYTSPSQEGIANSNEVPPYCKDMCIYKNMLFYANTKSKHRSYLTLISVDGAISATAASVAPVAGLQYNQQNIGLTASSASASVTTATANGLTAGMFIKNAAFASGAYIGSVVNATTVTIVDADGDPLAATTSTTIATTFMDVVSIAGLDYYAATSTTVSSREFCCSALVTPADDIELSAKELIKCINQSTDSTSVYAYYLSGYNELPGKILIEERDIGGNTFYMTSSRGSAFDVKLAASGTNDPSTNDENPHYLMYSKIQQPEAVPLINTMPVGSRDSAIKRILALKDCIFIFKTDGIYRLTGEDSVSFDVSEFDKSAQIVAPESARVLNNMVYCFSTQGVITISDTGVAVVSRPIERTLLEVSEYDNFASLTYSISYESDRKYFLYCPSSADATTVGQAFIFNTFTNTWTKNDLTISAGIVKQTDKKLYLANDVDFKIYQERKDFADTDYCDAEYSVTIASSSALSVTLTESSTTEVGMTIEQGDYRSVITAVDSSTNVITVSDELDWASSTAKVFEPISCSVKYAPFTVGNPGKMKHFAECTYFFRDTTFESITVGFLSNFSPYKNTVSLTPQTNGAWGLLPWGSFKWGGAYGDEQPLRTLIPLEKQRAMWLEFTIELSEAFRSFGLTGISVVSSEMSTRFR